MKITFPKQPLELLTDTSSRLRCDKVEVAVVDGKAYAFASDGKTFVRAPLEASEEELAWAKEHPGSFLFEPTDWGLLRKEASPFIFEESPQGWQARTQSGRIVQCQFVVEAGDLLLSGCIAYVDKSMAKEDARAHLNLGSEVLGTLLKVLRPEGQITLTLYQKLEGPIRVETGGDILAGIMPMTSSEWLRDFKPA